MIGPFFTSLGCTENKLAGQQRHETKCWMELLTQYIKKVFLMLNGKKRLESFIEEKLHTE